MLYSLQAHLRTDVPLFCLLLSVSFQFLFAEKPSQIRPSFSSEAVSLLSLTAEPASIVNGCVNVISGDYVEYSSDYTLTGHEPYTIGHAYSSSGGCEKGTLCQGFYALYPKQLKLSMGGDKIRIDPEKREKKKEGKSKIYLLDEGGYELCFTGDGYCNYFQLKKQITNNNALLWCTSSN